MDAGPLAVNYIIDHAEIDFVFVQDKKVKEVRKVVLFSDHMYSLPHAPLILRAAESLIRHAILSAAAKS